MSSTAEKTIPATWNEAAERALLEFLPNEFGQYECPGFPLQHWIPLITVSDPDSQGRLARLRMAVDKLIATQFSASGSVYEIEESHNRDLVIDAWRMVGFYGKEFGQMACLTSRLDNDRAIFTIHETLVRKQMDYGHGNIKRFGRIGLIVRIQDKVARLENLLSKGLDDESPMNESIFDNVIDVMGYSAIGVMWERGTFLLPLKGGD